MLQFLQENKERVIIPALTTTGLLLASKLGVPEDYNYFIPTVAEVFLFLSLLAISEYRKIDNEKKQEQSHEEEKGYLSKSLDSLLETKEKLKDCNADIADKLDKKIAETLDKIHESDDEEYRRIKQKQETLKRMEVAIRSEKESQKQSLYKAANVLSGEMAKEINASEKQKRERDKGNPN